MKIFHLTHIDMDAAGCDIILKSCFPTAEIETVYSGNKYSDSKLQEFLNSKEYLKYDYIYITDININVESANMIEQLCADKVILIDHHKTALWINCYSWATVKETQDDELVCATKLLAKHLLKNNSTIDESLKKQLVTLAECINKYDTWLWKTKYNDNIPEQLNDLFKFWGIERFIKIISNYLLSYKTDNIIDYIFDKNKNIIEIQQQNVQSYINKKDYCLKTIITDDNKKVGVVFAEQHISKLGNFLAEKYPQLDYIAIISGESVSLRSVKPEIDCSLIAKKHNGGGHIHAAGYSIEKDIIDRFINMSIY